MPTFILIYGHSGQGKTYLAERLKEEYGFGLIKTDPLYVEFIRLLCPMLYFRALEKYVSPHYKYILRDRKHSRREFQRDFQAEWHAHLLAEIEDKSAKSDRLAVEGYLLFDCREQLAARLKSSAQVFLVEVKNRTYWHKGRQVTIEEVASFGGGN